MIARALPRSVCRLVAIACIAALAAGALAAGARAAEPFADLVGPVRVEPVKARPALEVPYITWGGDVATFHANGGLTTQKGSIFDGHGLALQLRAGDDFVGQVRRYLGGETPFLRGTMRMLGQASEVIGSDPRTRPVVFLQLTWSAGDHLVGRADMKSLADLKGRKVALQKGGPHVGMLDDALRAARLTWDDIEIAWCDVLTGPGSPADLFRKDASVGACTVITPDMLGLTGGLEEAGSGAEGTVKGARVVVSTAQMSRSIADVYAVRKDWFDANRRTVEKLAAGYLKASDDLRKMRDDYERTGTGERYVAVLRMAQQIYGAAVIPTLEVDGHGLLLDATFVGLAGNKVFFTGEGNLDGFDAKEKTALDLAVGQGYARVRAGFLDAGLDYAALAALAGLENVDVASVSRFEAEAATGISGAELEENTIVMFTIAFGANQTEFDVDDYGEDFLRAVQSASTFGNAVVAIRGHADPSLTIIEMVKAGLSRGTLKRTGATGDYKYFHHGRPLDLADTAAVVKLIEQGAFVDPAHNPLETMQAALNLSRERAEGVKRAIAAFARDRGLRIDLSQIQPVGVGIAEPVIPKPGGPEEAEVNRRVEFRVIRVPAEAVRESDFDF